MKKSAKHALNPIAALFKQVDRPMMGVFDPDALMKEMIELIKTM